MHFASLSLTDFRNYSSAELSFPEVGLVVIRGDNGHGKTNLLEAVSYLGNSKSFRETTSENLIGDDASTAVVRGTGFNNQRELLIEAEISRNGRNRMNVNRQVVRRVRGLDETIAVTTFSPTDLDLVKAGPSVRRAYIDDLMTSSDERQRSLHSDLERILKQRNALLRQSNGRLTPDIEVTLDVWDERLSDVGEKVGAARGDVIEKLQPCVQSAYGEIAGRDAAVGMAMVTDWRTVDGGRGLRESLVASRTTDVARGVTTVGPHRDELRLSISGKMARSHASQGEQRSLAISLRLAGHRHVADIRGSDPVLLLDDVFSELDDSRTRQLLRSLPDTQCLLATAVDVPVDIETSRRFTVTNGVVT